MKPDVEVVLEWEGGERFRTTSGESTVILDGESEQELSPMQALAAALGGCMAIDVAMILEKGRQPLEGMRLRLGARRAADPPRRFVAYELAFEVVGAVDERKVQRAVDLSKEKYCSVWHSLNQGVDFETTFEIVDNSGR